MASGGGEYMMTKVSVKREPKQIAKLSDVLPVCCAKCGGTRFSVVEDGVQCINDGWVCYLTDELIETLSPMGT